MAERTSTGRQHADIPHGLGITDDEIDQEVDNRRECVRAIEQTIEMLEMLRELPMVKRLEIYELTRSLRDMQRLQRQRSLT